MGGERFPAAGGAAVDGARPALADAAELFFDGGDEFAIDGFAVGADVGGVDGVGIVVIGIGMLDEEEKHARELAGGPVLIKLVLRLRAQELVAGHAGVGRRGAEAVEVVGEVAVIEEERIVGVGMRSPAFGDDDDGAEVHGAAPEFGEGGALDADVFHPFGVFGRIDGWNDFGEMDLNDGRVGSGGIDMDFFGNAIEIARLGVPVLAFAFVHGELDGVAVGAVEGRVFVEDALDPIVAGGKIAKFGDGVAEGIIGDDGVLAGSESVDVGAEDLLGLNFHFEDLRAGLGIVFSGDDDVDAAVERSGAELRIEGDGEARLSVAYPRNCLLSGGQNCGGGEEDRERGDARRSVGGKSAGGIAQSEKSIF